jgi:histone H3/H4
MAELPNAPVERLAKKAGIERIADDAKDALAAAADRVLERKFKLVAVVLESSGKKTLTADIVKAL